MVVKVVGGRWKGCGGCGCIIRKGETYWIRQVGKGWRSMCKECVGVIHERVSTVNIPEDLREGLIPLS